MFDKREMNNICDWWCSNGNYISPINMTYDQFKLSDEECDEIILHSNLKSYTVLRSLNGGSRTLSPDKRIPSIQRLKDIALYINSKTYQYDLDDDFEVLIHKFQNGQGYCYHYDINPYHPYCKLTVSVQLSPTSHYSGGNLVFLNTGLPGQDTVSSRERGTFSIFPSFYPHKVERINTGVRYSLILFFYGPRFK